MRIVFMGTPDFAVRSLEKLYSDGHEVLCVFTKQDMPSGRGMKVTESPVKLLAAQHGTPVLQPVKMRDEAVYSFLRELSPEIIVVVAYGKILPKEILDIPQYGCINIHGSLLPKYRGSAPVQWSVINGDEYAGVTSMYLDVDMDTGDIIAERKLKIEPEDTSETMLSKLALLGAELLSSTLSSIENGTAQRVPQDNSLATYAPPLTKDMAKIDWSKNGKAIVSLINGLIPWPVAVAEICGVTFKIFSAKHQLKCVEPCCGTVLSAGKDGIEVVCGDGTVTITQLQAAGGKRMAAADYLRGHPLCQ